MWKVLYIIKRFILVALILSFTACASSNVSGSTVKVMGYKKSRCDCPKQMKELVNHAR